MDDFIKGLICSKFRCRKRSGRNILEPEGLIVIILRSLDDPYNGLLDKSDAPYKDKGVDGIEEGMQH